MKRYLKYTIVILLGMAGVISLLLLLVLRPRYLQRLTRGSTGQGVVFHVSTDERVVALTIDDGPHEAVTPQILDILQLYGVPATFFVLGDHVIGNEPLVQRMIDEGHEIGNHMLDDQRSLWLPAEEFERQINTADTLLRQFGPVHWYRPGSGLYDRRMIETAKSLGYRVVLGSVYPYDAQLPPQLDATNFVSNYVLTNTEPGSIIILHDGHEDRVRVVEVLTEIIPQLLADGYQFVTLSELAELE